MTTGYIKTGSPWEEGIRDGKGDWAIFEEMGSVPTSMSACRALQACAALDSTRALKQSDCKRAYVQADLDGPPTYIEFPSE